jgi:hypothetical protein
LITDDEDNIGVELVIKLAELNPNLVLVTKYPESHKELQHVIKEKYNTTLKLVKYDSHLDEKK